MKKIISDGERGTTKCVCGEGGGGVVNPIQHQHRDVIQISTKHFRRRHHQKPKTGVPA